MSKLRIVKERAASVNHEQDLRELGGTTLLSNTHIETQLHLHHLNNNELNQINSITANHKGMKVISQTDELTTITCNVHDNHKVNCLYLFNLALELHHKKLIKRTQLTENNLLHQELSKATNSTMITKDKAPEMDGLHLSALCTITLNQAGYSISVNENGHHLGEEHLQVLIQTITSGTNSYKKVRTA
jgi:hypothetical protein